jgi:hypothetical protein
MAYTWHISDSSSCVIALLIAILDDQGLSGLLSRYTRCNRLALWLFSKDGVCILIHRRGTACAGRFAFVSSKAFFFETGLAATLVAVPEHEEQDCGGS